MIEFLSYVRYLYQPSKIEEATDSTGLWKFLALKGLLPNQISLYCIMRGRKR